MSKMADLVLTLHECYVNGMNIWEIALLYDVSHEFVQNAIDMMEELK